MGRRTPASKAAGSSRGYLPKRRSSGSRPSPVKTLPKHYGLTEMELLAVNHYFTQEVNFSKVEACRRAGYSHPQSQAYAIFSRPDVVREVERRRSILAEDFKIGPAEILAELAKIAFFNFEDFGVRNKKGEFEIDLSQVSREQMAAIGEYRLETRKDAQGQDVTKLIIKPHNKLDALDKLGNYLNLFNTVNINIKSDFAQQIIEAKKRIRLDENNPIDIISEVVSPDTVADVELLSGEKENG